MILASGGVTGELAGAIDRLLGEGARVRVALPSHRNQFGEAPGGFRQGAQLARDDLAATGHRFHCGDARRFGKRVGLGKYGNRAQRLGEIGLGQGGRCIRRRRFGGSDRRAGRRAWTPLPAASCTVSCPRIPAAVRRGLRFESAEKRPAADPARETVCWCTRGWAGRICSGVLMPAPETYFQTRGRFHWA
jgi:hypothetical protein